MTTATAFTLDQTVRATRGPTIIVGKIVGYTHHGQPLMTIHPHGIASQFSTIDIWANDGWEIEVLPEVTG